MSITDIHAIVPTYEMRKAFGYANFGSTDDREILRHAVLKCAAGFHQGHTSKMIAMELGLIDKDYKLTEKGQKYLWAAFNNKEGF